MKKISVIIPVYNGEGFIAKAIKSVLRQSYTDYEIIIINDGSIDGTLGEIIEFGDKIKVISIPNRGVSNARNVGIEACEGEYIAFLDADDLWDETKLLQQITIFDKYQDVGFCCCNYIQENNGINHFDLFLKDKALIIDAPMKASSVIALINTNFVGTCSNVMIRRNILDQTGLFNTSLNQAEDYDLWIRCSLITSFFVMSKVLMTKINHENNLTNNQLETWQCHEKVLLTNLKSHVHGEQKHLIILINKKLAEIQYHIGDLFFNKSKYREFIKYYILAFHSNDLISNKIIFIIKISKKMCRLVLELLNLRFRYRED